MLLSELWPPRINSFLILRLWPFSNHEEKVLTPIFFSSRKICFLSPRALAMQYIFMATASYGGEATTLSFWVSECNNRIRTTSSFTTKSAEFYPIFLALGFCLFRNIFGRSTISDNFFELLRILHEISACEHTFFRCYLLFVSWCTTEDHKHLAIISEGAWTKQALPSRNVLKGVIGASWKFRGNFFCKEGILPFESDVIFFSSNGDSIIDDKHLRIISQRRLRHAIEKRLFPCRNIEVSLIWTSWKLWRKF